MHLYAKTCDPCRLPRAPPKPRRGHYWSARTGLRTPYMESVPQGAGLGDNLISTRMGTVHTSWPRRDQPASSWFAASKPVVAARFHQGDRQLATNAVSGENQRGVRRS